MTVNLRKACKRCGVWVCHTCWNFRRRNADRRGHQYCHKCGGTAGEFLPVFHRHPLKHVNVEVDGRVYEY